MKRINKPAVVSVNDAKIVVVGDDILKVLPEVYEPADDTYLLLEAACKEARPTDAVLEVGTGCGLIARALTKRARRVIATDINPHAVLNARLNGVNAVEANLFKGLDYKFDLIVFNPPYLPTRDATLNDWYDKALNGGPRGSEVVSAFITEVCNYLTPHGRVLVLISSLTGYCEVIESMLRKFQSVKTVAEQKCFFETLYVISGMN